ncbi:hypothetical protein GLOIN_2v1483183 [Rhizophagus irregularis DAOM 181602=DAOM 197198]|uniref:Uncharacterized protein n=1 Tax=Rhizophagus irregularis (strain DAOM 181602 / DAOM 197198 / MUCL 43194) TaxID=747089 RepID=A0A2P4PIZ1_RHIID|nr:hypothetical protein GLOIN_2v1483183 [Rhizophagus irregularis DAOM 181602=DAOM 197198]POG65355.1 hypothetical protein GLOIN_2v1483183 [Rhizophagus irregularis DAOM 181602=DAOM 197198]|eukprot:XP_025172221.1 hypothetical protein GLOIN_2v1483183 [Rhizophagus irregularis DAOM 181602=DAOM 197198]
MSYEIEVERQIDEKYDVDNPHEKRDKDEIVPHNPRDSNNAHNGNQVSSVSLSPNGKYVVTYSEDDKSIEGWIVKDSKLILDPEASVYKLPEGSKNISEIKVNDGKIVYIAYNIIIQMSNKHQQIKLNPPPEGWWESKKINFKKNGDFIKFSRYEILIYRSKHDKMSNELSLVSFYELSSLSSLYEVIKEVLIDDDNIWVISPNYLFHWDMKTFQLKFSYSLEFTTENSQYDKEFTVIHKESLIGIKYYGEIAIFLNNVHFPIRNIQLKNPDMKIELCQVQNNTYLLAFNIPKKDEKQDIILYSITDINKQQPIDASTIFNDEDPENDFKNKFILYEYNSESKEAFGLVDGKFTYINLLDLNLHEFFESHKEDDDLVGWNDYLGQPFYYNDTLAFPDMENIRSLLSESRKNMSECEKKSIVTKDINFNNQKYKWRIELKNDKPDLINKLIKLDKLSVYSDEEELNKEEFLRSKDLGIMLTTLNWKILNNNALALRFNEESIIIYEYDIHNKRIKTQYFINKEEGQIDFSGSILPMIDTIDIANLDKDENDNGKQLFTQLSESIVSIIEDERCLAKYGPTLLPILIESSVPKLTRYIEDIFNKCTKLVKDDPNRNLRFLNIITSSMNDLYKKYPDYITKFNSEMFMILNPFNEGIGNKYHSHFSAFSQEVEIRKEFYSNWNGEAIINFKWKTFGRIYYFIIWLLFMVFLVCFTIASYPTNSITQEIRIKLYQTTIAFGFYHLLFELRQFIWNPKNYVLSIWNLFDSLIAQNPNDPNNPWTLSNTYNQVDENGNILKETLIQVPSENTNLFYSYPTSLLATYLFLTAIGEDNDRASYLVQKAEVIAEIELFYLLPHQRRWRTWFPEVISYKVDIKKARKYIKEAIKNGEWKRDDLSDKILKLLSIEDAIKD